jgi:hypothetical protein
VVLILLASQWSLEYLPVTLTEPNGAWIKGRARMAPPLRAARRLGQGHPGRPMTGGRFRQPDSEHKLELHLEDSDEEPVSNRPGTRAAREHELLLLRNDQSAPRRVKRSTV